MQANWCMSGKSMRLKFPTVALLAHIMLLSGILSTIFYIQLVFWQTRPLTSLLTGLWIVVLLFRQRAQHTVSHSSLDCCGQTCTDWTWKSRWIVNEGPRVKSLRFSCQVGPPKHFYETAFASLHVRYVTSRTEDEVEQRLARNMRNIESLVQQVDQT